MLRVRRFRVSISVKARVRLCLGLERFRVRIGVKHRVRLSSGLALMLL